MSARYIHVVDLLCALWAFGLQCSYGAWRARNREIFKNSPLLSLLVSITVGILSCAPLLFWGGIGRLGSRFGYVVLILYVGTLASYYLSSKMED